MNKIKTALISVWDKENIVELAKFLSNNNVRIISTGGTKKVLEENNISVISISELTKQNEIMNGRVKTLQPKIFGGILADRDNPNHIDDLSSIESELIDLVVVNLYPFQLEAVENNLDLDKAIEFIDIGGPSMLRASAKNYKHVVALSNTNQYFDFIENFKQGNGYINEESRIAYAKEIFRITSDYDKEIFSYFNKDETNEKINLSLNKISTLRYGENPHQQASFYLPENKKEEFVKHHGKSLSYNNYYDIETASSIVSEFDDLSCVIIKHANPCGFATGDSLKAAYLSAISADPVSYFGGIVAFNKEVDFEVSIEMNKSFLECIVAPSFTKQAMTELKKKKNLRIITLESINVKNNNSKLIKSVFNGFLIQDKDNIKDEIMDFEVVSKIKPNNNELKALYLSWNLVKYVKSNAIVFSNDTQVLGVGAGQMSRIDSTLIAINKAKQNNLELKKSVMASDAFFPFVDCVQAAAKEGVLGVIQPGGSINDQQVIDEINKKGMFMVFTNKRHFYH